MTIKEARTIARMTQQDVEEEFGIPVRTLQNWESSVRNCPDYVEEWLKEKLIQCVRKAHIRWEDEFRMTPDSEPLQGYSCYLCDQESPSGEMIFSWFMPVEYGKINAQVVMKIGEMVEAGWKIYFV